MARSILLPIGAALAVLVPPASARAQAVPPGAVRVVTLEQAVKLAQTKHPRAKLAAARVDEGRALAQVPRAAWFPVTGITMQTFVGTTNNWTGMFTHPEYGFGRGGFGGVDFITIPRIGGTKIDGYGSAVPAVSSFAAAGIRQQVWDFGRARAGARSADAELEAEAQRERETAVDLTYGVEQAYFAVLANKGVAKAAEDSYERARVHRDLAKTALDAGLRTLVDVTRAEADMARADILRIRARGGIAVSQAQLSEAVGSDEPALDAAPMPVAAPGMPEVEQAVRQAKNRDPRILAAISELRASEQRTRAIKAELAPMLTLSSTVSGRAGGAEPSGGGADPFGYGVLPDVPNWDAGLVFSWPIFDGTVRARAHASEAEERADQQRIDVAIQEQVAQIRVTYQAVLVARETLAGLQRAVDAARASYDQAEARFAQGLGTAVEIADAEALRTDAEIQLELGKFELARARAAFGRAIAEGL